MAKAKSGSRAEAKMVLNPKKNHGRHAKRKSTNKNFEMLVYITRVHKGIYQSVR